MFRLKRRRGLLSNAEETCTLMRIEMDMNTHLAI